MPTAEEALRVDLAACYRLIALYGWDDLVFTHVSARVPGPGTSLPDQPLRHVLRGDHRLEPGQGRPARQEGHRTSPLPGQPRGVRHPQRGARGAAGGGLRAARAHAGPASPSRRRRAACCPSRSTRPSRSPRSATTTTKASRCATTRSRGCSAIWADTRRSSCATTACSRWAPPSPTPSSPCTCCSGRARSRLRAQSSGAPLVQVDARITSGVKENVTAVTKGLGGGLAWPGLLRKLDRLDPSYRQ